MSFELQDLDDYHFDKKSAAARFDALLRQFSFINHADVLAVLSCGGTISSSYIPSEETIRPTHRNVILDRLKEIKKDFGISSNLATGLSLFAKDSRFVTQEDATLLLDLINFIDNQDIIVTCGTYLLPKITEIINRHILTTSNKIVGVTGSMLTEAHVAADVEFNTGGVVSAVRALRKSGILKHQPNFVLLLFTAKSIQALNCKNWICIRKATKKRL